MIDFSTLENALKSLEEGLVPPPRNDRERDGAIQRFENCLELSWKLAQKVLKEKGLFEGTPKDVIRELAKAGHIQNPQIWVDFVDARNKTSHIYKEEVAKEVFKSVEPFLTEAKKLLQTLKQVHKS